MPSLEDMNEQQKTDLGFKTIVNSLVATSIVSATQFAGKGKNPSIAAAGINSFLTFATSFSTTAIFNSNLQDNNEDRIISNVLPSVASVAAISTNASKNISGAGIGLVGGLFLGACFDFSNNQTNFAALACAGIMTGLSIADTFNQKIDATQSIFPDVSKTNAALALSLGVVGALVANYSPEIISSFKQSFDSNQHNNTQENTVPQNIEIEVVRTNSTPSDLPPAISPDYEPDIEITRNLSSNNLRNSFTQIANNPKPSAPEDENIRQVG